MPCATSTSGRVEQPQAGGTATTTPPVETRRQSGAAGVAAEPAASGGARKARAADVVAARRGQVLQRTRLCKYFMSIGCDRGSLCTFAHGEAALRPQPDLVRTQLCNRFARTGVCAKGDACNFAHGEEQLRRIASKSKAAVTPATKATMATGSVGSKRACKGSRVPEPEPVVESLRQQVAQLRAELAAFVGGGAKRGVSSTTRYLEPPSPGDLATATPVSASDDWPSEWRSEQGGLSPPTHQLAGAPGDEGAAMVHSDAQEGHLERDDAAEEVLDVEFVVRNTFLNLEPVARRPWSAAQARLRSSSAPAARISLPRARSRSHVRRASGRARRTWSLQAPERDHAWHQPGRGSSDSLTPQYPLSSPGYYSCLRAGPAPRCSTCTVLEPGATFDLANRPLQR
eukprot:CAMPEP_0170268390 /NCGR_PEP_ID=MMETSP0116_2-20130129/34125_1 /TAXON_ID=400756 /ORGANISM="Durinskia baltica, Strain CSIRO CS-38" /LENGTH=399 /DNA_ID=CAMNT_0010519553 /DNA_START=132 /DNA_END=1329 /DNA_ORIENTATION=+